MMLESDIFPDPIDFLLRKLNDATLSQISRIYIIRSALNFIINDVTRYNCKSGKFVDKNSLVISLRMEFLLILIFLKYV